MTMKVMLETGLMFGEERQLEVTLRELTTGDLLDAETAAERLVMTAEGEPVLVKSPALFAYEILRRQIAAIGKINGPISLRELRTLTTEDVNRISVFAQNWESAKADQVVARGRLETADS